eukprot:g3370.t1
MHANSSVKRRRGLSKFLQKEADRRRRKEVEANRSSKNQLSERSRFFFLFFKALCCVIIVLVPLYLPFHQSPFHYKLGRGDIDKQNLQRLPKRVFEAFEVKQIAREDFTTWPGPGKLSGPDSYVRSKSGNLYAGLSDGRIIRITKDKAWEVVVRTGIISLSKRRRSCYLDSSYPIPSSKRGKLCGRPIALRIIPSTSFDSNQSEKFESNVLLITDAYLGLLGINLGRHEDGICRNDVLHDYKLAQSHDLIDKSMCRLRVLADRVTGEKKQFRFLSGLAVVSHLNSFRIFFTEASTLYDFHNSRYEILSNNDVENGRAFEFRPLTKTVVVLEDSLPFVTSISVDSKRKGHLLFTFPAAQVVYRYDYLSNSKDSSKIVEKLQLISNQTKLSVYWIAESGNTALALTNQNQIFQCTKFSFFLRKWIAGVLPYNWLSICIEETLQLYSIKRNNDSDKKKSPSFLVGPLWTIL